MVRRHVAVAAAIVLVVSATSLGLTGGRLFWRDEPEPAPLVPRADPGMHVDYEVIGRPDGFWTLIPGEHPREPVHWSVHAGTGEVADASGLVRGALLLELRDDRDVVAHRIAVVDGEPIADARVMGGRGGQFPPLVTIAWHWSGGLGDGPLFWGMALEPDTFRVVDLKPWTVDPWTNIANYSVVIEPWEDMYRATITSPDNDVKAIYDLSAACPLPLRVERWWQGTRTTLATATSCERGTAPATAPDADTPPTAWQRPSTSPYTDRFPGDGHTMPIRYDEAYAYFLSLPEAQSFFELHPDAVLGCAEIWRIRGERLLRHDWDWRFMLVDGESRFERYVTKLTIGPLDPGVFVVDEPPLDARTCLFPEWAQQLAGAPYTDLDDAYRAFQSIFPERLWRGTGEWRGIGMDPFGLSVHLSRCSVYLERGGGICFESVPFALWRGNGLLSQVNTPCDWVPTFLEAMVEGIDCSNGPAQGASPTRATSSACPMELPGVQTAWLEAGGPSRPKMWSC